MPSSAGKGETRVDILPARQKINYTVRTTNTQPAVLIPGGPIYLGK
ncbi:MAG TPA: hypothetical protein PK011_14985 [Marinagarivorans sp.]|nr:hypothetical protein [Cellvibrionaceae bacterium]HMY40627.1 hypothetical protein [Marinagarivorans sp.]HNG58552.1 hypothetical protein [Cellvibrionaceae bacterium]